MTVAVPTTLDDAVRLLAEQPDAMLLAGGTDAMVEINDGHRRPDDLVIALNRVGDLRAWRHDTDRRTVTIGAGVTYTELMQDPIATLVPALAEASRTVGSPQIRNAGTLGGNLGTCSPAGDGLPVLSALDAQVRIVSAAGERSATVHDLMVGVKRTSLEPGELIAEITLPVLAGWQGYAKVGVRNAMVIAVASACLAVDADNQRVAIALGSVGPTVIRCHRGRGAPRSLRRLVGIIGAGRGTRRGRRTGQRSKSTDQRSPLDCGVSAPRRGRPGEAAGATSVHDRRRQHMSNEFFTLRVNGSDHEIADSWLGESLLDVLRDRIGLMGSKGACTQGECGSCSVHGRRRARLLLPGAGRRARSARKSSRSRGLRRSGRRAMCSRRSSTPVPSSAASAPRVSSWRSTTCSSEPERRPTPRSGRNWPATSAAAPATAGSSMPSSGLPSNAAMPPRPSRHSDGTSSTGEEVSS